MKKHTKARLTGDAMKKDMQEQEDEKKLETRRLEDASAGMRRRRLTEEEMKELSGAGISTLPNLVDPSDL